MLRYGCVGFNCYGLDGPWDEDVYIYIGGMVGNYITLLYKQLLYRAKHPVNFQHLPFINCAVSAVLASSQDDPLEGSAIQVIYDTDTIPPVVGDRKLFISGTLFRANSGPTVNLQTNAQESLVAIYNSTFTTTVENLLLGDPRCDELCVESEPGVAEIFTDGVAAGDYSKTFPETPALEQLSWERAKPSEDASNWIYDLWQVRVTLR